MKKTARSRIAHAVIGLSMVGGMALASAEPSKAAAPAPAVPAACADVSRLIQVIKTHDSETVYRLQRAYKEGAMSRAELAAGAQRVHADANRMIQDLYHLKTSRVCRPAK